MDPQSDRPTSSIPEADANPSLETIDGEPAAFATGVGATPVPRSPVAAGPATGVGGSRARWLIGGGIAVAAVAALALAAVLVGARPLSEVLKYLPVDSAVVVELHPELPGDQRQRLGNFLAHFPGFADQAILDQKIDEVLDQVIREGSRGTVDYTARVKPLLAGPMALSMSAAGISGAMSGGVPAGLLLVATTDGTATCDSVFGSSIVGEAYRDVEIRVVDRGLACVLHGRFMLLGDIDAVRGGLDARLDARGMDGSSAYRTARATLEGEQLAIVFVDGHALEALLLDASGLVGGALPPVAVAPWMIAGLSAADDALVVDAYVARSAEVAAPSGGPSLAPAAESRLAAILPADTLGYIEVHGVGALLNRALAGVRANPSQAETLGQLEQALSVLGGTANVVDWIEELGIAVIPTGDAIGGALLIRGTDADTATARITQVRNLLVLAATGTDITVRNTEHNGVTITSVDLGDLSSLLGGLGVPGEVGDMRLQLALAARDDLVIVGLGDGVVERVLDVEAGTSLQTAASYRQALGLAGSRNDLQVYVAIDAVVAFVEGLAPTDELETWTRDFKPYVEHLAAVAGSSTNSATTSHSRFVLTVK